jgi:hypothetical protein
MAAENACNRRFARLWARRGAARTVKGPFVNDLRAKLKNPFALIGQGFVLGAILFFAIEGHQGEARSSEPDAALVEAPGPTR